MWELDYNASWAPKNWCFWTVVWRRPLRVPWTARRSNQSILKEISPSEHYWKDWCWNWNSNTFATWCKELIHLKRPWCWERLKAGGEQGDRGWDDWMASPTQWTWVRVNCGSWWGTGKPGVLQSMVSQSRTWLSDWTELVRNCLSAMFQDTNLGSAMQAAFYEQISYLQCTGEMQMRTSITHTQKAGLTTSQGLCKQKCRCSSTVLDLIGLVDN